MLSTTELMHIGLVDLKSLPRLRLKGQFLLNLGYHPTVLAWAMFSSLQPSAVISLMRNITDLLFKSDASGLFSSIDINMNMGHKVTTSAIKY